MAVQPRRVPGNDLPRTLVPDGLDEPTRKIVAAIDQNFRELLRRITRGQGPAFPTDPPTGMIFVRTDQGGQEYQWNGTLWLTTQRFHLPIGLHDPAIQSSTTAGTPLRVMVPQEFGVHLDRVDHALYVETTNDVTNNWTVEVQNTDTSGTTTNYGSVTTAADSPDTRLRKSATITQALPSNSFSLTALTSKTGTPGALTVHSTLTYRLIG